MNQLSPLAMDKAMRLVVVLKIPREVTSYTKIAIVWLDANRRLLKTEADTTIQE
jgi:hypothetical protein